MLKLSIKSKRIIEFGMLVGVLFALMPFSGHLVPAAQLPYPQSPVISGITFDPSSHVRLAPGSDNWPVTWADDDHQYTSFGDGGGFGGTNSDGRVSLGVARVQGNSSGYQGYNVWGGKNPEHPAQFSGKSYGIISVAGVLYMWVSPLSNATGYDEARLARSTDHGATWTRASWAFTKSDNLVFPTILQFGKDYAGARDNYVYSYSIRLKNGSALAIQLPGELDLLRVPKDRIMDRASYEFFAGLDANNAPRWTTNIAARVPVFKDPNGVGWTVSASFNAGIGRYLLATEHTESFKGNLGLFDAPEPWGPWTTAGYYSDWGGYGTNFFWNFSNKWLSADGKNFTFIFTGIGANDSWNTVRGSFITGSAATPTPIATPTSGPSATATRVPTQIPSPTPAPAGSLAIANTTVASGKTYHWDSLATGKGQYIDRSYTFSQVPAPYLGLSYLKTSNDDQGATGSAFVSFDVNQNVTVYVAHDERISPKPSWLSSFTATSDTLTSGGGTFRVYSKAFPAGRITLGGNEGGGASMYTVIVRASGAAPASTPGPAPGVYSTFLSPILK